MLLDYERYHPKTKKKKTRFLVLFLILAGLGVGAYFVITRLLAERDPLALLTARSPEENLAVLWNELVRTDLAIADPEKRAEEQKKLLAEILKRGEEYLQSDPLSVRLLVYHGFGSFFRALQETSFETQLPYLNQALVSLRRALLGAGSEIRPQLAYMLGRVYFYKRNSYYDLAARYLEQAVKLGYNKADAFEYLVLIYSEWGEVERAITCLEQAVEEEPSEAFLFHLAKSYKKVNRIAEAKAAAEKILSGTRNPDLRRECQFLLGEIHFEQSGFKEAERIYRDILAADKNSAEAHFRLALIYEKLGDYAQYRYELRLTMEIDGGHSGARSRLRAN